MIHGSTLLPRAFWDRVSFGPDGTHSQTGANLGPCWIWTGKTTRDPYGQATHTVNGHRPYAHRATFEATNGPVPDGFELDHLCRVTICCNPTHLEAVTHAENVRRSRAGELYSKRTHCPAGHPYDATNTLVWADGKRRCRTCRRVSARRRTA